MPRGLQLAQVLAHQPGHLEHGDFILSEDGLELGVRQDVSLVLRVLQVVGLEHGVLEQRAGSDHAETGPALLAHGADRA